MGTVRVNSVATYWVTELLAPQISQGDTGGFVEFYQTRIFLFTVKNKLSTVVKSLSGHILKIHTMKYLPFKLIVNSLILKVDADETLRNHN